MQKDITIFQNRLKCISIGHEVRRDITLIELHPLHDRQFAFHALAFLDFYNTLLADFINRISKYFSNVRVIVRADCRYLGDIFMTLHTDTLVLDKFGNHCRSFANPALNSHRINACRYILQPFVVNSFCKNGRSSRTVTDHIRSLARHLVHHLGANVLKRLGQFDFFTYRHAVLGYLRRTPALVQNYISTRRTKSHLHRRGKLLQTVFQLSPGVVIKHHLFCHFIFPSTLKILHSTLDIYLFIYFSMIPRISLSLQIIYFSPSISTSLPIYRG